MSEKHRDIDYLLDIREAIRRILDYTASLTWQGFLQESKTQDAVVRNQEVIREATKSLSSDIRSQYPQVKWQEPDIT